MVSKGEARVQFYNFFFSKGMDDYLVCHSLIIGNFMYAFLKKRVDFRLMQSMFNLAFLSL